MSALVSKIPSAVATVPVSMKKSKRIASMSGRKAFFHGRRYLGDRAWCTFYSMAASLIPDDLYDWEDDSMEFEGHPGHYDI